MSADLHARLNVMSERAQRHLDGFTINRDAMARDVLLLVGLVRAMKARQPASSSGASGNPRSPRHRSEFQRMFDDIFAAPAPPPAAEEEGRGASR